MLTISCNGKAVQETRENCLLYGIITSIGGRELGEYLQSLADFVTHDVEDGEDLWMTGGAAHLRLWVV